MLIEEIDENNFEVKTKELEAKVESKLKKFERQIELAQKSEKEKGIHHKVENEDTIDWYQFFDPTIWAYKHLRDKQNKPLKLRGFQDRIITTSIRLL